MKEQISLRTFILRLVCGAKQFDLFANGCFDGFHAGSEKFTGIETLTFQILAGFHVLTGSGCECQLAFRIYIDLGNTQIMAFLI